MVSETWVTCTLIPTLLRRLHRLPVCLGTPSNHRKAVGRRSRTLDPSKIFIRSVKVSWRNITLHLQNLPKYSVLDVFPTCFEGARVLFTRGLSNHFQISHTIYMSSVTPSGYRFGATYIGTKQLSPTDAYPIMLGDIDPSGNLNATIVHQLYPRLQAKFGAQVTTLDWRKSCFEYIWEFCAGAKFQVCR